MGEYMKTVRKIRDIHKLEERQKSGETLDKKQVEKIDTKEGLLKDVASMAAKLPPYTELLEKTEDITKLLPLEVMQGIEKRRQQDNNRRQRNERREVEERKRPEFMCRHDRPILAVTAAEDEGILYTCSKDKYVISWSMKSKLLGATCTFAGHTGAVWSVDLSPTRPLRNAWLASGSADSKVALWAADAGVKSPGTVVSPVATFEHGGIVRVLRWCPFDADAKTQRLASASEKFGSTPPLISIWSISFRGASELLLKIDQLPTKANTLEWAIPSKPKLLSAHDNGYVGVWSVENGALLKRIKLHSAPVSSMCLSSDGETLVSASHDASFKAIDLSSQETPILSTYKADRPLNAVAVTADFKAGESGFIIVGGGRDTREVTTSKLMEDEFEPKIVESTSGMPIAAGASHFGPVHAILSMPGKEAFATVGEDGCLKVHRLDGSLLHADTM